MRYWSDPPDRRPDYDRLVARTLNGELAALEELLRLIQDGVFNLALKFLWQPEDAADATQEILLRITTHLKSFRGESSFPTWAYRVAVNYLLNERKGRERRRAREEQLTRESFRLIERELRSGSQVPSFEDEVELAMLRDQVRLACLHAMLQCLPPDYRVVFVLGSMFDDLKSDEAAYIVQVEPATYRKRLSRARQSMAAFMGTNCGLVNANASCRCANRIDYSLKEGRLDPYLKLAARLRKSGELARIEREYADDFEWLAEMTAVYRESGAYVTALAQDAAPANSNETSDERARRTGNFAERLRELYASRDLRLNQNDPN